jgi:hypothetical protein
MNWHQSCVGICKFTKDPVAFLLLNYNHEDSEMQFSALRFYSLGHNKIFYHIAFEVLTAMTKKMAAFRVTASCDSKTSTFRNNMSHPSSRPQSKPRKEKEETGNSAYHLPLLVFSWLTFVPKNGGGIFLRNFWLPL